MKTIRKGLLLLGLLAGMQLAAAPVLRIRNQTTKTFQVKFSFNNAVDATTLQPHVISAGWNLEIAAGNNCFDTIEIYNEQTQLVRTIRLSGVPVYSEQGGQPQPMNRACSNDAICMILTSDSGGFTITGAIQATDAGTIGGTLPQPCGWSTLQPMQTKWF